MQQVLAIERLERRTRSGHDVDLEAARPRLAHDALQEPFRIRAPDFDLDAIFAVEGRDQRGNVVGRDGRVEGKLLLSFGAFEQPLLAVGALVGRDLGDAHRLGERAGSEREQRKRRQAFTQDPLGISHADRAPRCGWCRPQTMAQFCAPCQRSNRAKKHQIRATG